MVPLPPREQRHPFLRYQGLDYTDADISDFKERLERIYGREIHGVQVVDFLGMPKLMRDGLFARMVMKHRNDFILASGLHIGEEMESPGFARDLILRLFHRMMAHNIAGRSQALEKVTVIDLFYLRGMDVGLVNVPYLLARDTWRIDERQPDAAAGAPTVTEDASTTDEGDQAILALVQALQQPPPPSPPAAARTMPQRLGRLEEEVQGLRRDVGTLRGLVERSMTDQGRFSTCMMSCMAQLMDASGLTYQAFDRTF
ncbi:hypothetical protein Tco_0232895 [Tanacetum coccineum]